MANVVYENKVLEAKAKDLLLTAINAKNFMTIDSELAQNAGMKKVINVYTYSGEAEELGVGEGNGNRGSISYVPQEYEVKMVQQAFDYFDEDFMKDNTIVDNMLKGANQVMINKMTSDFVAEIGKAKLKVVNASFGYDIIVDGISEFYLEDEKDVFYDIPNT